MHTYMHVCMHAIIHTYIHTYTFTHTSCPCTQSKTRINLNIIHSTYMCSICVVEVVNMGIVRANQLDAYK